MNVSTVVARVGVDRVSRETDRLENALVARRKPNTPEDVRRWRVDRGGRYGRSSRREIATEESINNCTAIWWLERNLQVKRLY